METGGGGGSETGSAMEGEEIQKSTTSINANLTPDFSDRREKLP